jgi:formylglycine-generating enzyme required for sulfatase activity
VDLPSEIEWEWIAALVEDQTLSYLVGAFSDNDWMLDLVMNMEQISQRRFNNKLFPSMYYEDNYPVDGAFYTHPADLKNKKLHKATLKLKNKNSHRPNYLDALDSNGVSCMSNNVSEWLRETYSENWELMFQRQLKLWEQENTTESLLLRQIALYHDSFADKDGQLVKGGSWLDERFSIFYGKNKAGIHAKTFVSPTKSHSTLGFRYVIYFME